MSGIDDPAIRDEEVTECYEHGIAEIEVAASNAFNRAYQPRKGVVKWFEDDMGQQWVKWNDPKQNRHCVVPADRVVIITYFGLSRSVDSYDPDDA